MVEKVLLTGVSARKYGKRKIQKNKNIEIQKRGKTKTRKYRIEKLRQPLGCHREPSRRVQIL